MKYKLIVFDIDGTITKHISSWRYIHEALNLWDALAFKYQEQFLKGSISYRKFCELDAAHWKGLEDAKLRGVFKDVPYSKNVKPCILKLKKLGFKLVALSTGLQYIANRVKNELNFDYVISNRLNVYKGRLTGGVTINISHGGKGSVMKKIIKNFHIKPSEVIVVGDSAGDISLARHAGYSIAFNSSDEEFSQIVNYECKTNDFMEIFRKIEGFLA
ncbi:MAG: HAD-IB family phosphatase [Candidatus Omnitrophota bacterium]